MTEALTAVKIRVALCKTELKKITETIHKSITSEDIFINKTIDYSGNVLKDTRPRTYFPTFLLCEQLVSNPLGLKQSKRAMFLGKVAATIRKELSPRNTLNYFERTNSDKIYPDDIDDTFRGLSIIAHQRNNFLPVSMLTSATKLCCELPRDTNGLYQTWISTDARFADYDIVANCALVRLLSLSNIEHKGLLKSFGDLILSDSLVSKYYCLPFILHELSILNIDERSRKALGDHAITLLGGELNWLQMAWCISAALRSNISSEIVTSAFDLFLNKFKNETGLLPLYIEKISGTQAEYAASKEVQSLFAAEAILLFLKSQMPEDRKASLLKSPHLDIITSVESKLFLLSEGDIWMNVLKQSRQSKSLLSISTLCHRWNSINSKNATDKSSALENMLSEATLFGWLSYSVFDSIMDGEDQYKKYVPLAECAQRHMHSLFCDISSNSLSERKWLETQLSKIERAHFTELRGCPAIPSDKSAGHMIGPLLLLIRQGHLPDSLIFKNSLVYFEEYLTIRQLSDDLHDFKEDWNKKISTLVTDHVRQQANLKEASNCEDISQQGDINKIFIESTLPYFSKEIIRRGDKALRALKRTGPHRDPQHFKEIIIAIQNGARRALLETKVIKRLY